MCKIDSGKTWRSRKSTSKDKKSRRNSCFVLVYCNNFGCCFCSLILDDHCFYFIKNRINGKARRNHAKAIGQNKWQPWIDPWKHWKDKWKNGRNKKSDGKCWMIRRVSLTIMFDYYFIDCLFIKWKNYLN